jgi:hypothetical protein
MGSAFNLNQFAIITCSYSPDFHRCQRLCESIDKWVQPEIEHVLIVPKRDLNLFKALSSERRKVVSVESIVPGRYIQLPFTNKWWLDSRGWPVRGWIMQQITKLSACHATTAEHLLYADSDIQFIAPLKIEALIHDGKLRLHRIPNAMDHGLHLTWHKVASRLLGVEEKYSGADYIGQLISWRSSILKKLQSHIEATTQKKWNLAVGQELRFSEYILYGTYVDRVLEDQTQHFPTDKDLSYCCWDEKDVDNLTNGTKPLSDEVCVLFQSNLDLTSAQEEQLLNTLLTKKPTV